MGRLGEVEVLQVHLDGVQPEVGHGELLYCGQLFGGVNGENKVRVSSSGF